MPFSDIIAEEENTPSPASKGLQLTLRPSVSLSRVLLRCAVKNRRESPFGGRAREEAAQAACTTSGSALGIFDLGFPCCRRAPEVWRCVIRARARISRSRHRFGGGKVFVVCRCRRIADAFPDRETYVLSPDMSATCRGNVKRRLEESLIAAQ